MPEHLLILAPRGRDAPVIEQVLKRDGILTEICPDLAHLRACFTRDIGGVLVTEEALAGADQHLLLNWFQHQPAWSDLPVIVMATRQPGRRSELAAGLLESLGNVILLERPVNAETLTRAARACLRARRRQYQARSLLLEREQREAELRDLNETLERRVKQRTEELDRAHETLAFALDSAGMGSWDMDLRADTARRSPQHARIFGYTEPPTVWGSDTFLAHVIEDDRPFAEAAIAQAMTSLTLDLECRIRRPDGTIRWIVSKGRVVTDAHGEPVRMAGVVMDTTDRRATEDALHQAQKMEAIGQLTGGVAHDFNNLLTVIVGGLDMLMRRPDDTPRVTRLAQAAMTAARRGEQLTQQLLAFSRRQVLRPQTVDPNRVLAEFEPLCQRAVGEAVTLRLALGAPAHAIRVDPAQFESAVLNLIVNARDAMPRGGLITVSTRSASGPQPGLKLAAGNHMVVSVADTGTGFSPEALVRAFEPFFTTKDVGRGSGLGLSQVYGFTRSAGGDVNIRSEPGRGTVVELWFPRAWDAVAEHASSVCDAAPRTAAAGETVLLVEDDEQVLAMAIESLQDLRYSVLVARNAYEALDHLQGPGRIDVLFSDVVMPGGMNGTSLAEEARRLRGGLKVLLASGYIGNPAVDAAITEDVDFLSKPYRRDELALKLRQALER